MKKSRSLVLLIIAALVFTAGVAGVRAADTVKFAFGGAGSLQNGQELTLTVSSGAYEAGLSAFSFDVTFDGGAVKFKDAKITTNPSNKWTQSFNAQDDRITVIMYDGSSKNPVYKDGDAVVTLTFTVTDDSEPVTFSLINIDCSDSEDNSIIGGGGSVKFEKSVDNPVTEADTEPDTEAITERDTEAVTERETEAVTERETEAVTERETEAVTERETEAVTERDTEAVTERDTEAVTEPDTEAVTERDTEAVTEPEQPATKPSEPSQPSQPTSGLDEPSDLYYGDFIDVRTDAWYCEYVKFVCENGFFVGISETEFAPDMPMTRAMFVTVLGRIQGVDPAQYKGSAFSDVQSGKWYAPYVKWAAENKLVLGMGEGLFSPDAPITREQIATLIKRYGDFVRLPFSNYEAEITFTDKADISEWALTAVRYCAGDGIVRGYTDGRFLPKSNATRAEVAAIIQRFLER